MRYILAVVALSIFFVGCSNTAKGVKKDINEGAEYVEKNTR